MDRASVDKGPDLDGLRQTYTMPISRTLRWVGGLTVALISVASVLRLLDDPDSWDIALSLGQIGFYFLWSASVFILPPAIYLNEQGVRVRKILWWGRPISWQDVVEVQAQGRWQDASLLVFSGAKTQRLIGMPKEDAELLARALLTWRRR